MASKLFSIATTASLLVFGALAVSACASSTNDASTKEEAADETSQSFSLKSVAIAGSLDYGQTSAETSYTGHPRYVAYKFSGHEGDTVDVWVRSPDGDTVAWILDNDWKSIAKNDDASSSTLDSHVTAKLPKNASDTHYVVVRDYWRDPMSFTVELKGSSPDMLACNVDADCAKVEKGCCALGMYIPLAADQVDAYRKSLNCPAHQFCPMIAVKPDYAMPECNRTTHKCELVKPADIACGGFIAPAMQHECPQGYDCRHEGVNPDLPGKCVQRCGGIAAIACHADDEACVDDPTDSCDPAKGGADCGGICQPKTAPPPPPPPADCRSTGCDAGKFCSFCWGSYACIPNGAMC